MTINFLACLKSVSSHLRSSNQDDTKSKQLWKKNIYIHNIRMINLPLNELKLIAKSRRIKGYKSMSKKGLLNALNESESVESEKNLMM